MIVDKIENVQLYAGLSNRIDKALNYMSTTDLVNTEIGKYEIEGNNVFALVQEYTSKNPEDAKLESHFEHIDIQYIISGEEMMGLSILTNQVPHTVIDEKDVAFYPNDSTPFKLEEGMFAILFPNDLHCPGMKCDENSKVKKL
ncbi:YhcH/YjgK/YiaL family protein, partial [Labilibaculum sp.]|uniref:YhcH/YjgK/YiaL family protein n=1 Tax=Labilibaculum sp. TaxID=2060723 RepID=UPI00356B4E6F